MKAEQITCDVLVVGAGVSGIAAAVTASQKGLKTFLLEQNNFIGGTAIAGMHRYLCGLYGEVTSKTINSGVVRRLLFSLSKLSRCNRPLRLGKVYVFAFRNKDLKICLLKLIKDKRNLKIVLNQRAYSVKLKKGLIQTVQAKSKGKTFIIRPKVVIDSSGEGAVIKLSRAQYYLASCRRRQLAGFSFRLKGLKNRNELLPIKVPYYIKFATYTPLDNRSEALIRMNIPAGRKMVKIKKAAKKALGYLRQVLPEFKNAYIAEFSPSILEREGVRLRGKYTLTAGDILRARKFKDGVVKSSWPIELWDRKTGPHYQYLNPGRYYEIPLRCLKSKNIKNLLACGRCISVTREALGSTRAAGTCLSLGEQAAIAALKLCASY